MNKHATPDVSAASIKGGVHALEPFDGIAGGFAGEYFLRLRRNKFERRLAHQHFR